MVKSLPLAGISAILKRSASSFSKGNIFFRSLCLLFSTLFSAQLFKPKVWILLLFIISAVSAQQASAQFTITENFKGSSTGNITIGGNAKLTSGKEDPVNNGWLRLTPDSTNKLGFGYVNQSFPSTLGVLVDFEYTDWRRIVVGLAAADGFSVFLYDATKANSIGGRGGSLGYAPISTGGANDHAGVVGGYVGIGLDEYGNFSNPGEGRTGGVTTNTGTLWPDRISMRGSQAENYKYLTSAVVTGGVDYPTAVVSRPDPTIFYRRVQIEILPIVGGVDNGKYQITVKMKTSLNGNFATILGPYTMATPPPANLKLGFAGSTGGSVNNHEVRNVIITTPGGVRVDKAVDKSSALAGEDLTYTVNVTNSTPAGIAGLKLADTIRNSNNVLLTSADFTINSITFNNNGNAGNTAPGYTNGTAVAGGTNPFNATLNMAANTTSSFTIKGTLNTNYNNSIIKNSVGVDPSPTGITDTDLTNNYYTVSTNVLKQNVDLAISGTVDNTCYVPGGNTFNYSVINQGATSTVGLITVRYAPPAGFSVVGTPVGTGWTVTLTAGVYNFTRTIADPLASGFAYPPIIIKAVGPSAGGPWTNQAAVFYALDSDLSNNIASVLTYAVPGAPTTANATVNYCLGATASPLTATGSNLKWYTVPVGGMGSSIAPTPSTTTAGTTSYYVTSSNGTCEGPMATINVVVQPVITGNTITANQTICSGTVPGPIQGAVPTGGSNVFTYSWEQSENGGAWTAATGTNTQANYTPPALTTTTAYRRNVTGGACLNTSNVVTITVQPIISSNTIVPPSNLAICGSGDPGLMTGSTALGGTGTPVYQWQSSTDNVTYTNIAAATGVNYDPGAITVSTWYRRTATSGACTVANISNVIKFTVNPVLTAGTIGNAQSFCSTGTPATFNELTPATGGDQIYAYQWQKSTSSATTGFADIPGATQISYSATSPITQTTYYRRIVSSAASGCGPVNTTAVSVTVTPAIVGNTIVTPAVSAFCGATDPGVITGAIPTGGNGTYVYSWEKSINGGNTWTPVTGNAANVSPGIVTVTSLFRRTVVSGQCTSVSPSITIVIDLPPDPSVAGPNQQQCATDLFQLNGNVPTVGTGTWAVTSGQAVINNVNLANTTVVLAKGKTATLSWTIRNGSCPASVSTIVLTNFDNPSQANAGQDITQYNSGSFTMNANVPTSGTGVWTVKAGSTATIATPTAANTLVTIAAGTTATLVWTVTNGSCASSSDEVKITYTQIADIKVSKSVLTPGPFIAGQPIVYRILATNNGPSDAIGLKLLDNVPADISVVSITANAMGTAAVTQNTSAGNTVNLTGDIAFGTGNSITVDVNGTVAANYSGSLSNTVTVTSPVIPDPDGATSTVTSPVDRKPVLLLEKDGPSNVIAGDAIAYKIIVKNTSSSDAIGTRITDLISSKISNVNWTLNKTGNATFTGSGTGNGNNIDFNATIPAGLSNTVVINVSGTVLPSATGSFSNTATATPVESVPPVNSNTVVSTISSKSGLVMLKNGPANAQAGSPIVYTLKISNNGLSDALNANILDEVPANVKSVTWNATVQGSATIIGPNDGAGNLISLNGNIPTGSANAILVTINGTVDPSFSGSISNTATATPSEAGGISSSSTVVSQVSRTPVLTITKTGPATVIAGQQIAYTITVTNTSTADAKALVITDAVPADLSNLSWSTSTEGSASVIGSGNGTANAISVTGNLPAGSANKIIINVTGRLSSAFSGSLANTATASPSEPGTVAKSATSTAQASRLPVLSILKTGPATIISGQQITYTVTVTNTGASDAVGLQIADLVPAVIKNVTWTSTLGGNALIASGDTGIGNNVAVSANIPAGAANKVILTIRGTVDPGYGDNFTNTATATPSESTAVAVSSSVMTIASRKPELSITKTGPATLVAGQNITYTITVNNFSTSDARGLVIADQVPGTITGVTWLAVAGGAGMINGTASGTGNAISLNADLPSGANNTITLTVKGKVASSFNGTLSNTATASPAEPGTVVKSASSTTTISRTPVLAIQKTGPATISAGQQINYTLTISNTGTADATNATITDAIPAGITNVSWTATADAGGTATIIGSSTGNTNALTFNANIPAGINNVIRVNVQGNVNSAATGTLVNTATVTPSESGANPSSSSVTTTLQSVPGITLSKSGPSQIAAGQLVTYMLIAGNTGPSDANNLNITDAIPVPLTNVSWTAAAEGTATVTTGATGTGNSVTVIGNIAAGTGNRILVTITGLLPSNATATTFSNVAKASPTEPGVPPVNSNTITTVVNKRVTIAAVKSATAVLSAGENITYTLEVKNTGPSDAQNMLIGDQLPAGIINASWTSNVSGTASIISGGTGSGSSLSIRANIPAGTGNVILVTVTGKVDPNFTGTQLVNTFTVDPLEPGNPTVSSNTTTTLINKTADLQILKTGPATAIAGRIINYTITVNNAGPSNANNVNIVDQLPAGITGVTWVATAQNGALINVGSPASGTNNNISVFATIPSNSGTVTINVSGTIDPAYNSTVLTNVASATPEAGVTDPSPALSIVNTAISRSANVRIVKSGPANITAGEPITYNLRIVNDGPSFAPGILIRDLLPGNSAITNVSWTATASTGAALNGGSVNNTVNGTGSVAFSADIPSKTGVVDVIIRGIVNPGATGAFVNTATALFPNGSQVTDPDLGSNTSSVTTAITVETNLAVSKSGPSKINIGDPITYTITVKNNGLSNIMDASITDVVPNSVAVSSWMAVASNGASVEGQLNGTVSGIGNAIITYGNIPSTFGGSPSVITLTIQGIVKTTALSSFTNTVSVEANGVKQSAVVTALNESTDIFIEKNGPQSILAGAPISYQIKVGNDGPINVAGLSISDVVPSVIQNVSWTATAFGSATITGAQNGNTNNIQTTASIEADPANYILINIQGTVDPATNVNVINNVASVTLPAGVSDFNLTNNTSAAATTVASKSGLSVRKMGPADAIAGSEITYTIILANAGPSNAVGTVITDAVPANIKNVSWTSSQIGTANVTAGASGTAGGNNLVSVTADIPAGAGNEVVIVVKGTIDPSFVGALINNAVATPNEAGNPPVTSQSVTTTVTNKSALSIVKTGPSSVAAGTTVQYQLLLSNAGPSNAVGAIITDQIPAGLTNVRWSTATTPGAVVTSGATGNVNPVSLTANFLAGSGNLVVTILADVPANSQLSSVSNTASVAAAIPDVNNPTVTSNEVTTSIVKDVTLSLTKSGPPTLNAGENITYTLAIKNTGPSNSIATRLTDVVPAAIQNVSWTSTVAGGALISQGAIGNGNNIDLSADIPLNGTILVNVNGNVDPLFAGTIINTAVLSPQEADEQPVNATAVTEVGRLTNLQISKSATATAVAGQVMTYQIKVINNGPSAALNALITDAIPVQLQSVTWTATTLGAAVITEGANGIGNSLSVKANIPAGQHNEVIIEVTGTILASYAGTLSNIATVTPADPGNPPVVTPPVETVVTQQPMINLSKTGSATVSAGGQISYTIEANNTGLSDAKNLVISDTIDPNIKNVSWTSSISGTASINSGGQGAGNALLLNGNIPAGAGNKITIIVKGTVDPAYGGSLSNTATATPEEPGIPPVVTPPVETTVNQVPVIVLNKTGPASATAGGAITYVLEVANTGLSNARNLNITDQIDPAITNVSWTASTAGTSTINGAGSGSGNVLLNANIPAGAGNKVIISISGTINAAASGKVTNIAIATPSESGLPAVNSNPVETNIDQKPVVVITKTGQPTATAGGVVNYVITAVNTGLSNASGVTLLDQVPSQIQNVSWTSVAGGTASILNGGTGTGNLMSLTANIPAGNVNNKITITLTGTVNPAFSGELENVASIAVPLSNFPNVVTPPVETVVDAKPGITLTKAGPAAVISGSEVVYTIIAGNTGLSNATALSITDAVPVLLSNVSWTSIASGAAQINSGGSGTGNTLILNADIPTGAANLITITVRGTVDPAYQGNLRNTATATPSEPGTVPVQASSTATISKIPVLAIAKNGPGTIAAGQEIIYTLSISNTGKANSDNATITDVIPANITGVSWQAVAQGAASIVSGATGNTNNLSINVHVPAGAANTILVTIKGTVSPAATAALTNVATITPAEAGTAPASSTVTTNVTSVSSVSLVKTGPSNISAGQTVTYTLLAGNNGPSDTYGLNITDAVPAGLTGVSWSVATNGSASVTAGASGTGNNVLVTGDIPAGSANQILVTITGKVPASAGPGTLSNMAIATPSEAGNPPVNSNTITTTVDHIVNIRAVKSALTTIAAGENINYTLEVYNDGPGDALNLAIKDVVPAGINNVSWNTTSSGSATIVSNGAGTGSTVNPNVNIPAGAGNYITVAISGIVDPGFTGTVLKNSFTATPSEPGNPPVTSTEVTTGVTKTADLQITKTGPSAVVAGSEMSYTIKVTNAGPGNSVAANIVDNVPAGFTVSNWTATGQNGAVISGPASGAGNVNVTAAIPVGNASVEILVSGRVNADFAGTSLTNTSTAVPEAGVTDPTPASSTVTTSIGRIANVRITKSGPADIAVGEMMTYNLRIVNDGPSDALGLLIKDVIPPNLEANSVWTSTVQGGATLSQASGTGDINLIGNIPAGNAEILIQIMGKVKADNLDKTVFTNTATAYFPAGSLIIDPDLSSNISTVPTIINNDPVLKVSKSGPATVNVGDPIEYTIVIRNGGAGNIVNAMIADPVPDDVAVTSWTASAAGGAILTGLTSGTTNAIVTSADIPADADPNTAVTIKVIGTVKTTAKAVFTNTVTVTANGERKSSVVTAVNQSTDIKVEKTGPQASISGSAITYTIKVTNQGPRDVVGLIIKDNVPLEIEQISWSAQANGAAVINGAASGTNNGILLNADVPVGGSNYVLITVNGKVNANVRSGTISNVATATLPVDISDFNLFNNSSEVKTVISSISGLTISKAGPQDAVSGSAISYTIKVRNSGLSNAIQAQIRDVVPAELKAVSWTAVATGNARINSGLSGTGNNVLVNADIPVGINDEITLRINATIDPAFSGIILNSANVTPSESGNPVVTSAVVSTNVLNKSGLKIVKSGPNSVEAGTRVNYTLTINNTGPGNAVNAEISDAIPAQLTNVSWTSSSTGAAVINSGATGQGNALSLKADLPAGNGIITVNITGLVPSGASVGNITNTATVIPSESGNPPVISNTVTTAIVNNASISLAKSGPGTLNSGEVITYTLTINNTGPSDAIGLKVSDVLDAAINNVSWNTTALRGASVTSGATGNVNDLEMLVNVPANGSILVNISGKVNASYAGILINKATLTSADPGKPVINAQVSTTVTNLSALKITKTGAASVTTGGMMKYQIKVVNNGPGTAQDAVISDIVPSQLSGVSWTAVASGAASISMGQTGSGNMVNVTATIPSGNADGITIDLIGKLDPNYSGTLSNIATVTPKEPGNPAVVTPPVTTVTVGKPAITITKTGPATITAGANITYVIEVGNTGLSNARGTVITDNVPTQISNVKWTSSTSGTAAVTAGSSGTGNAVNVTADIVAGTGNKITITITGTLDAGFAGSLSNVATATPAEPGNPAVVTPPVETVVSKTPLLSISKTGPAQLKSGEAITYVVTVSNTSLSNADQLTITDLVPVEVQNVKWTSEGLGAGKVISGGTGTGNRVDLVADLPAGTANKIVLTITGTVSKSFTGKLENTARVLSTIGTPEVSSNSVVTTVENADFIVPNIITPNGDGSNDTFKIKGLENYPGTQVSIFNRWGNEVYRSDNYTNDWDGSQLNEGTYYYLILRREKSGQTTPVKGWLFIKR
ncbi:gliding motility-associated C-terminal domain-containing protein [Pedobacter gandavensis]|uniref:T9SS type B sorting domain-containing protein n=1 Tax=Pedobacter gandavensis TaxID=2679963 RepID=UPI00292DC30B|nr:gliding motility-associated C-terminal domain-containing protein [Pedobacter gandavensis]